MKQANIVSVRFLPQERAVARREPAPPRPRGPRGPSAFARAVTALVLLGMLVGPML